MTVDLSTVTGCMRTIVIPAMNVRKTVNANDNVISFTPLKTGTIKMSCGMGMGVGDFTVISGQSAADSSEQNSANSAEGGQNAKSTITPVTDADQKVPAGGSCGAAGGGCGCGG
jgi:plastocyanin domain-containing protein